MKTMRISNQCQVLHQVCLPKPGTVIVLTGDEVKRGDLIAEAKLPERFLVYDVVNQLKLPPQQAEKHIQKLVGEYFSIGDVIAQKTDLFSRIFRARQNGKVVSIRDGKVVLALGETSEFVTAPFPGVITELIHERGAVIATVGAVVEGVLAGAADAAGELVFPSLELDWRRRLVDEEDVKGNICFCKTLNHPQLLSVLVEAGAVGLVLGSITPAVFTSLKKLTLPWLLLGGFGAVDLDNQTLSVLEAMEDDMVYLVKARDGQSPMLLCITDHEAQTPDLFAKQQVSVLEIGSKVKLWGQSYQGRVGEVVELPEGSEASACGGSILPVVVKLSDELIVRVPVENLVKIVD